MTAIEVSGVSKAYGGRAPVQALVDVDLVVPPGSLTALLGPSGCGKTTLLRVIAGFERPDRGRVASGGRVLVDVADGVGLPPEQRSVGVVAQEGGLFPHLDVAANVGFGLRRLDRTERRTRVAELLDLVDLAGYERRRPHELSGGQQQRVALARALATRPSVLLLDEPFASLDAGLRASVRNEVADVLAATSTTSILVTHDRSEAMTMADSVAVMTSGRIRQVDDPVGVYHNPVDASIAELTGEAVWLDGTRDGDRVVTVFGTHDVRGSAARPTPNAVRVLVRPEQIAPAGPGSSDAVRAVVRSVELEGSTVTIQLVVGGLDVEARWLSTDLPAPGDHVAVTLRGAVCVYPADGCRSATT